MRRTLRSLPALVAVLGLVGLGGTGCAKKIAVDQIGAQLVAYPEGRRDTLERTPSDLVVWLDAPDVVQDNFSPGGSYTAYRTGPGAVQGQIFDYIEADGYQLFRRESGGGYHLFNDFVMTPYRRWADRAYYATAGGPLVLPPAQFYTFSDAAPPATPLAGYVGRAVISGFSGADYPLTNLGETASGSAIPNIHYTGATSTPDSLIRFEWDPVAGAAGYWVHVYQTRADVQTGDEAVAIGLAAPVAIGKVRDFFVGFIPAPLTSYKLGDPLPLGARVLVYRTLPSLVPVLVRVSAVDAGGNMIATMCTVGDMGAYRETIGATDRIRTFFLGAFIVTPRRPPPPTIATGLSNGAPEVFDSGVPGLTYIRTSASRLSASR
jgi:hypothetical protein